MPQDIHTIKVRVWDLPTRTFHAVLALCVFGLMITGGNGDLAMTVHFYLGYTVLTLVLFRIIWGCIGGYWSRFSNFIPSPTRFLAYFRSQSHAIKSPVVGHNPLGALSVLAFLIAIFLQAISGLMSDDDISISGPWAARVPNSWVGLATKYHTEIGFPVLLLLVGIHIAAVFYYLFIKKQNLIQPMINGDKLLSPSTTSSRDNLQTRLVALAVLGACAYVVFKLVTLTGSP
ncbi:MAG: cytochrome b/b6 domain-containing protein [Burkholderiales bacterium]|nr:cytochrome b/b6 domain-containing protein [Burkholderiales bacterium]